MNYALKEWPLETLPQTLDMMMGTLDREDIIREGVRVERQLWWDQGIEWVRRLVEEGGLGAKGQGERLPRHPIWDVREFVEEKD